MSNVRFIADLHLGHEWMAEHRGFKDVDSHDEYIINQWNKVTNKKDTTYVIGDVTMESSEHYHKLDLLKGRKIIILGNHDIPKHIPELLKHVDKVASMIRYKGIWLTHCPIHPSEFAYRVSKNIHGHIHEKIITETTHNWENGFSDQPDERYINVSCEQVDYTPRTLKELGIIR